MKIHNDPGLLVFRIIEYGLDPDHQYFSINQLALDLQLNHSEVELAQHYVIEDLNRANPNHLMQRIRTIAEPVKARHSSDWLLTLLPNAIVTYNEFEEIRLARQNAHDAMMQSKKSYRLAMWALIVSAIVGGIQIGIMI